VKDVVQDFYDRAVKSLHGAFYLQNNVARVKGLKDEISFF
jgi:hypothetical protein